MADVEFSVAAVPKEVLKVPKVPPCRFRHMDEIVEASFGKFEARKR